MSRAVPHLGLDKLYKYINHKFETHGSLSGTHIKKKRKQGEKEKKKKVGDGHQNQNKENMSSVKSN